MPEIRRYTVIETRKVRVQANSARDATMIAAAAFDHGQDSRQGVAKDKAPAGIWGNTTHAIRVVGLETREDGGGYVIET